MTVCVMLPRSTAVVRYFASGFRRPAIARYRPTAATATSTIQIAFFLIDSS